MAQQKQKTDINYWTSWQSFALNTAIALHNPIVRAIGRNQIFRYPHSGVRYIRIIYQGFEYEFLTQDINKTNIGAEIAKKGHKITLIYRFENNKAICNGDGVINDVYYENINKQLRTMK